MLLPIETQLCGPHGCEHRPQRLDALEVLIDETIANLKVLEPDDLTMIILVKLEVLLEQVYRLQGDEG